MVARFEATVRERDDMATWNEETYGAHEAGQQRAVNVGNTERAVSTVGGAALALYGLSRFRLARAERPL
jgi:uncharacterized membrane protein